MDEKAKGWIALLCAAIFSNGYMSSTQHQDSPTHKYEISFYGKLLKFQHWLFSYLRIMAHSLRIMQKWFTWSIDPQCEHKRKLFILNSALTILTPSQLAYLQKPCTADRETSELDMNTPVMGRTPSMPDCALICSVLSAILVNMTPLISAHQWHFLYRKFIDIRQ